MLQFISFHTYHTSGVERCVRCGEYAKKNLPPHHYAYIRRGVGVVRIVVNLKCGERYEKKNNY